VQTAERDLTLADVAGADEVFMTNALFGIWPVAILEDQTFARGPITERLMRHLRIGPDA
jgi:4-amino-4-deoxychorismate lyase